MTVPPTPEAVEAAMKCVRFEPMMPKDWWSIGPHFCDIRVYAGRILAAVVERLRCELGHAQDQLERVRTLCMGSGVGLREDVLEILKKS